MLFLVPTLLAPGVPSAQDVQPRVYTPAPVGVDLLTLGYSYSSGEMLFDKTIPIDDASGRIHGITLAYSRSVGVRGMSGRVDVALSMVAGEWEGELRRTGNTSRAGPSDPTVGFSWFFVGAPALTPTQFRLFRPTTTLGASLRVGIPLGRYDPGSIVNIGSNRWTFRAQFGVSHPAGPLFLEAYAGAWLFTENDEFLGDRTLSQRPLYTFQVHVGYRFRRGLWAAASSRQSLGGATRVDGGNRLAPEANNRVGLTLAIPVATGHTVRVAGTTGLVATVGNDYSTAGVAWQIVL